MGVAYKSAAKIYRNSRKSNQSINGGSGQKCCKNLQKFTLIKPVLSMGVADKSAAKIYKNSRKVNLSINEGSHDFQTWKMIPLLLHRLISTSNYVPT